MDDKTEEMNSFLDEMTLFAFGRSRSLALAGNACVACGKPAIEFKNERSRKEYSISGLCESCQSKIFD